MFQFGVFALHTIRCTTHAFTYYTTVDSNAHLLLSDYSLALSRSRRSCFAFQVGHAVPLRPCGLGFPHHRRHAAKWHGWCLRSRDRLYTVSLSRSRRLRFRARWRFQFSKSNRSFGQPSSSHFRASHHLRHFMLFNANESRQHQQTRQFTVARTPSITRNAPKCAENGRRTRHARKTVLTRNWTAHTHARQRTHATHTRPRVTHAPAHKQGPPRQRTRETPNGRHFARGSKCDANAPSVGASGMECAASLDLTRSHAREAEE